MKLEDYIHNEQIEYFVERTQKHINLHRKAASFIFIYDPIKFEGILQRAVFHDATKYSEEEILAYTVLTWKYKLQRENETIEDFPPEIQAEIDKAIKHHLSQNKHHPAYWANDLIPEKYAVQQMTNLDIADQICDWYSMSVELGTDIYEWARSVIGNKWEYNEDQVKLIYELLSVLKLYEEKYKEL